MDSTVTTPSETQYLVPRGTSVETAGSGPGFDLGSLAGKRILVVLRISAILEQEALDVAVWGSADGNEWGSKPLFEYPQQFYTGVTPAAVDLTQRPEVRFLKARWHVNRWGRGYPRPRFEFAVELQPAT